MCVSRKQDGQHAGCEESTLFLKEAREGCDPARSWANVTLAGRGSARSEGSIGGGILLSTLFGERDSIASLVKWVWMWERVGVLGGAGGSLSMWEL